MAPKKGATKKGPPKKKSKSSTGFDQPSTSAHHQSEGPAVIEKKSAEKGDDGMNFVAEYIWKNTNGDFVKALEELIKRYGKPLDHKNLHNYIFHNIKERILDLYEEPKIRWHPLYRDLKYIKPENEVIVNMLMNFPDMCSDEKLVEYEEAMKKHKLSESHIPANAMNLLHMWTQFYLYENKTKSSSTSGTKKLMLVIEEMHFKKCIEASQVAWHKIHQLEKANTGRVLVKSQLSYDILANLTNYNDVMANDVILKNDPELRYCEEQHKAKCAEFINSMDLNAALKFRNNWKIVDEPEMKQRQIFFTSKTVQENLKDLTEEEKEQKFREYMQMTSVRNDPSVMFDTFNITEEFATSMDDSRPVLTLVIFKETSNIKTAVQGMKTKYAVRAVSDDELIESLYHEFCEKQNIHPDIEFYEDISSYNWPPLDESVSEQQTSQSIPSQQPNEGYAGTQSQSLQSPTPARILRESEFMDDVMSELQPTTQDTMSQDFHHPLFAGCSTQKDLSSPPHVVAPIVDTFENPEFDLEDVKREPNSHKAQVTTDDSDVVYVPFVETTILVGDSQTEAGLHDYCAAVKGVRKEIPEEHESEKNETQNPIISPVLNEIQTTNGGRLFESEPSTEANTEKPSENVQNVEFKTPSRPTLKLPTGHINKKQWKGAKGVEDAEFPIDHSLSQKSQASPVTAVTFNHPTIENQMSQTKNGIEAKEQSISQQKPPENGQEFEDSSISRPTLKLPTGHRSKEQWAGAEGVEDPEFQIEDSVSQETQASPVIADTLNQPPDTLVNTVNQIKNDVVVKEQNTFQQDADLQLNSLHLTSTSLVQQQISLEASDELLQNEPPETSVSQENQTKNKEYKKGQSISQQKLSESDQHESPLLNTPTMREQISLEDNNESSPETPASQMNQTNHYEEEKDESISQQFEQLQLSSLTEQNSSEENNIPIPPKHKTICDHFEIKELSLNGDRVELIIQVESLRISLKDDVSKLKVLNYRGFNKTIHEYCQLLSSSNRLCYKTGGLLDSQNPRQVGIMNFLKLVGGPAKFTILLDRIPLHGELAHGSVVDTEFLMFLE